MARLKIEKTNKMLEEVEMIPAQNNSEEKKEITKPATKSNPPSNLKKKIAIRIEITGRAYNKNVAI